MIKDVQIKGIRRNTPEYVCQDGESMELVNVFSDNGAISPITPPKQIYILPENRKVVYVHRNQSYENLISYDNNSLYYEAKQSGNDYVSVSSKICEITELKQINSVGNILIAVSSENTYYIIFKNGIYSFIGNSIPFPELSFYLTEEQVQSDNSETFSIDLEECIYNGSLTDEGNTIYFKETIQGNITNMVMSKLLPLIAKAKEDSRFVYPFFVRYAVRLFDDSLSQQSAPLLMYPVNLRIKSTINSDSGTITYSQISRHKLSFSMSFDNSNWSDIIKSVDIFISPSIYTVNEDGTIESMTNNKDGYYNFSVNLPMIEYDKKIQSIKDTSNFYLVKSIELSSGVNTYSNNELTFAEGILDNISAQEELPDDYDSHAKLIPGTSYVYNGKLHIANLKKKLFNGFPNFVRIISGIDTTGSIKATAINIAVYIQTDSGPSVVIYSKNFSTVTDIRINPFLYYPDSRAYKLIIKITNGSNVKYQEFALTAHEFLNGSYYLGYSLSYTNFTGGNSSTPMNESNSIEYLINKMYVSELYNPFSFPLNTIYTISNDEIIGMVSATQALSQGQFGEFPLYIFTREGIWAMQQGASAYSSQHPVTRDVCNNSRTITPIDNAIVFSSDKGILVLNGSEVKCISEELDGINKIPIKVKQSLTGISNLIDSIDNVTFKDYSKTANIGYDYNHSLLYIISSGYRYGYVYNIKSGMWSKIYGEYSDFINAYPELLCQSGNNLYSFSSILNPDELDKSEILIITRPIKFGSSQLKKLNQLICSQSSIDDKKILLFGSRDGSIYNLLGTSMNGRMHIFGSSYKYFILSVSGSMKYTSSIFGFSVDISPSMGNKLR